MSVSSVIRGGLGSTPSDLVRLGLESGAAPTTDASAIITLGLLYAPSRVVLLGLEGAGAGSGPTPPNTVAGTATSDTTATLTWVDASSDETSFTVQIRTAAGPGAWGNAAGATNPTAANVQSFTATGLTAAMAYDVQVKASNGSGDSAYVQSASSFTTDNPGGGGGTIPPYVDMAATGGSGALAAGASSFPTIALAAAGASGVFDGAAGASGAAAAIAGGSGAFSGAASAPATAALAATGASGDFSGAASVSSSGSGATAAEIWAYAMSNGKTAHENVVEIHAMLSALTADNIAAAVWAKTLP